ncbi:MAG: hypothetical protein Q8L55_10720 [Phycisphaerales bacterium]|nr:hypothetical protein [Phycisphaerales bacterium]
MIPYVAYHQASPAAPQAKPVRMPKPKPRKVTNKRSQPRRAKAA